MKRNVLKKWVVVVLGIINFFAIMVMGSDCVDVKTFLISHFIAASVFILNSITIVKYGKKEKF